MFTLTSSGTLGIPELEPEEALDILTARKSMPRVVDDVMMTSTLHCRLRFCWLNPLPTTMDASDGGAFNERILEGLRPNFFELLSQEAMHNALRPACQYFMKVKNCFIVL